LGSAAGAIVPLATLLSRATEAVAARTGDAVAGLLNAILGNLTELLIALAAKSDAASVRVRRIGQDRASVVGCETARGAFQTIGFVTKADPAQLQDQLHALL
jgi:hypothetical protein